MGIRKYYAQLPLVNVVVTMSFTHTEQVRAVNTELV